MKTTKEYVKYQFSEDELKDLSNSMARKVSEKNEVEDQKKSVNSDFKAKIDGADAEINGLARKVQDKYEMRYMECEIIIDHKKKKVMSERLDTKEIVRERDMTEDELQQKLFDEKK